MRFILLLIASLVLVACASVEPKYKIGDCINTGLSDQSEWDSDLSGNKHLRAFKIVSYMYSPVYRNYHYSMERAGYIGLADRYDIDTFYVVRYIDIDNDKMYNVESTIPMQALDNLSVTAIFWEADGGDKYRCNKYEEGR